MSLRLFHCKHYHMNMKWHIPCITRYCMVWYAHGYCEAYRPYMLRNCPASCKQCRNSHTPASTSRCEDKHDDCDTWATYNLCDIKRAYMKENCPKSCGVYISLPSCLLFMLRGKENSKIKQNFGNKNTRKPSKTQGNNK